MAHVDLRRLKGADLVRALTAIKRGDVLLVDLAGAQGREQEKTRPCVVVSKDSINKNLSTVVVVPISTHEGSGKVGKHEVSCPTARASSMPIPLHSHVG